MKTLFNLLYEATAEPEAPEGSIYGQYLFAPRRSGEVPEEPNIEPEETRLFDALRDFMGSDNNHQKLQALVPEILEVMKRHDYAPVLDAGSVKVYRGMTLPQKTLEDMSAGASTTKEVLKAGRGVDAPEVTYFAVSKQGKLNPREKKSILQSWTTDLSVALMFSLEGEYAEDDMGVPVVFVANTSDSMFFGQPQKLSSIVRQNYYEKETISIGPVTYSGFVYAIPLDQGLGPNPRSVNPNKLKELVNKL